MWVARHAYADHAEACMAVIRAASATGAHPELIDAGPVVALLVSGTDSYGSLSGAKGSRAAVSAEFSAEHVPVPAHHMIRNQVSKDLRESGTN